MSFQPSEFAKLAAIVCMAAALTFFWDCHGEKAAVIGGFVKNWHVEEWKPFLLKKDRLFKSYGLLCLIPPLILSAIILLQPDAGTAIILLYRRY